MIEGRPPIDLVELDGRQIYVIRDDLTSPWPAPNNSKIRGVWRKLLDLKEQGVKNIASQDTRISRCGWGVSYVAKELDMKHYNFYPRQAKGKPLPFYQEMSKWLGADMIPLRGNRASIVKVHANQWLSKNDIDAYYLPIGLSMPESTLENSASVQDIELDIFNGSLVACVSSGTILSGILHGLIERGDKTNVYGVLTSSFKKRENLILSKVKRAGGNPHAVRMHNRPTLREAFGQEFKGVNLELIDLDYGYHQTIPEAPPFPCDLYLDRKAWKFIVDNIDQLEDPIVFWNVGGEWDPHVGLKEGYRGDGKVTMKQIEDAMKQ